MFLMYFLKLSNWLPHVSPIATRFADQQNFSRPGVRTNYGVHTFNFVSSRMWQTTDLEIILSNSVAIFRKKYTQSLLLSQI